MYFQIIKIMNDKKYINFFFKVNAKLEFIFIYTFDIFTILLVTLLIIFIQDFFLIEPMN